MRLFAANSRTPIISLLTWSICRYFEKKTFIKRFSVSVPSDAPLLSAIAQITAAYLGNGANALPVEAVPQLIRDVRSVLLEEPGPRSEHQEPVSVKDNRPDPAVPVAESVTPDYLVCLEDGKKLKVLTSHLKKAYNLTPREYRLRWDLPRDYLSGCETSLA